MPETAHVHVAYRSGGRELTPGEARARDVEGLPYEVVYRAPGREMPLGVRMVAWRAGTVDAWAYDEQGRRTAEAELRMRDDAGRLLVRRLLVRRFPDARAAESDPDCPRTAVELSASGTARISHQPGGMRGDSLEAEVEVAEADLWMVRPGFDDWAGLPVADSLPDWVGGLPDAEAAGWRRVPSRLRGPADFDRVFRAGTEIGGLKVLDPVPCGSVRVPSGVLVVACPDTGEGLSRITVDVPPGTYPMEAAWVQVAEEYWGSYEDVAAVRLLIGDGPAVVWEMALGPGDDTLRLREGEAFGFGTDAAAGAFGDAEVWEELRYLLERARRQGSPERDRLSDSLVGMNLDGGSLGADLAVFCTGGDGVHPVWVGRSASGEVVRVAVRTAFELDLEG
ncbi:DUF4241 domain-containing protein [Streptomyces katrae]|uniref:DUF4241 domain-containing protein n=1 Tax=Streptomyces katrae TaxID=68223 RepID=A0ABT7GSG0_9ACTN|nr:DUF4241 domain-containing protein [Streptomyces katrae]MDK9496539.1 DUF4241 domain-containing protein [Streptomyces katrae]